MAYGDAIMATATARGMHAQGKIAAFGDPVTKSLKWTGYCDSVFKHNPNILQPGMDERKPNVIWFKHYKKTLSYYTHWDGHKCKYFWNYDYKHVPGEFFFAADESLGLSDEKPYIMIEPNVAWQRGSVNINKDWGEGKHQRLADALIQHGHTVVQCIHEFSRRRLNGVKQVPTKTFRDGMRVMARAKLFIGAEGGNHHAAAALNIPAVIIWGDWSPPQVVGYQGQTYLTGGGKEFCGNTNPCPHCRATFERITVDEVYQAAIGVMNGNASARPG
jgi:ADP-heptose:LPS heptosyltransferase